MIPKAFNFHAAGNAKTAAQSKIITFTPLQPSFISIAKSVTGSRNTACSTLAFPPHIVMSCCETETKTCENRTSTRWTGGVSNKPIPKRNRHANKAAYRPGGNDGRLGRGLARGLMVSRKPLAEYLKRVRLS